VAVNGFLSSRNRKVKGNTPMFSVTVILFTAKICGKSNLLLQFTFFRVSEYCLLLKF